MAAIADEPDAPLISRQRAGAGTSDPGRQPSTGHQADERVREVVHARGILHGPGLSLATSRHYLRPITSEQWPRCCHPPARCSPRPAAGS